PPSAPGHRAHAPPGRADHVLLGHAPGRIRAGRLLHQRPPDRGIDHPGGVGLDRGDVRPPAAPGVEAAPTIAKGGGPRRAPCTVGAGLTDPAILACESFHKVRGASARGGRIWPLTCENDRLALTHRRAGRYTPPAR